MPDKPVPDNDPIVTKSYAAHYMIAMLLLMVTLLWALWDEAFGMRPWKAYQHVWKERYTGFLKTARSKSAASQKEVEDNSFGQTQCCIFAWDRVKRLRQFQAVSTP